MTVRSVCTYVCDVCMQVLVMRTMARCCMNCSTPTTSASLWPRTPPRWRYVVHSRCVCLWHECAVSCWSHSAPCPAYMQNIVAVAAGFCDGLKWATLYDMHFIVVAALVWPCLVVKKCYTTRLLVCIVFVWGHDCWLHWMGLLPVWKLMYCVSFILVYIYCIFMYIYI